MYNTAYENERCIDGAITLKKNEMQAEAWRRPEDMDEDHPLFCF